MRVAKTTVCTSEIGRGVTLLIDWSRHGCWCWGWLTMNISPTVESFFKFFGEGA